MTSFIVTTKRTRIRKISLEDAPFLLELLNTEGWINYIGDRNLKTISDVESYIEKFFIDVYQEYGFGYYLISSLEGNNIGIAGFLKKPYLENEDYGFAIHPKFYQKGFGYEIGEALIGYGIKEFAFTELDAVTMQSNTASQRLLKRLGFTKLGLITLPEKTEEDFLYRWQGEKPDHRFSSKLSLQKHHT